MYCLLQILNVNNILCKQVFGRFLPINTNVAVMPLKRLAALPIRSAALPLNTKVKRKT